MCYDFKWDVYFGNGLKWCHSSRKIPNLIWICRRIRSSLSKLIKMTFFGWYCSLLPKFNEFRLSPRFITISFSRCFHIRCAIWFLPDFFLSNVFTLLYKDRFRRIHARIQSHTHKQTHSHKYNKQIVLLNVQFFFRSLPLFSDVYNLRCSCVNKDEPTNACEFNTYFLLIC